MTSLLKAYVLIALAGLLAQNALAASHCEGKLVGDLIASGVQPARGLLPPSRFKLVPLAHLAHADMLWVNVDQLLDDGLEMPPEGVTPAFLREMARNYAVAVRTKNAPRNAFLDNLSRFFAQSVEYGSIGMNGNLGDGRAAGADEDQWKSAGPGGQIGKNADQWHKDGFGGVDEAVDEAWIPEIFHYDTPAGANRANFIYATGLHRYHGAQGKEALAAINRKWPLRIANYLEPDRELVTPQEYEEGRKKVREALKLLPEALPQPEGKIFRGPLEQRDHDKIASGLREWIRRFARQKGYSYAAGLFQGAASPSNGRIDGADLDFATAMGFVGYPRLQVLDDDGPFGDTATYKRDVIYRVVDELKRTLPAHLRDAVPSREEADQIFDETYKRGRREGFLELAGTPPESVARLIDTPEARRLGKVLYEIARAGNDEVIHQAGNPPENSGKYDLHALLVALGAQGSSAATRAIPNDPQLAARLVQAYDAFVELVIADCARAGIRPDAVRTYFKEASAQKNRPRYEMSRLEERGDKIKKLWGEFTLSKQSENPKPFLFQDYIDGLIERNRRSFKDAGTYETVIRQKAKPTQGIQLRYVYDAKRARYGWVLRLRIANHKANFFGSLIQVDQLEHAKLHYQTADGKTGADVPAQFAGKYVEFRFPDSGAEPGDFSLKGVGGVNGF